MNSILEFYGIPKLSNLDPISPVPINNSESKYEDALEEVFN